MCIYIYISPRSRNHQDSHTFKQFFFPPQGKFGTVPGAHVTGLNIDQTQLKMARELLKAAGNGRLLVPSFSRKFVSFPCKKW